LTADQKFPASEVAAYWRAARQVSGDFYDFLALPNNTYGFVIADVADKGIPAALFMALCRTIIRSVGFTRLTPGATLSRANDIIVHDTESDLFVTTFYTVWNPETRTLTYANGGHNPPMYVRSNGETTYFRADGIAMGIIEEMLFVEESVQLEPGDTVVLYTDGVNETMNADQNEFGLERLRDVITATQGQSAAAVCDAITNALDEFAGNASQFDDTTFVVIQCR
ncbi:MAG: serine/threonine-protein phosphatase, partial [Phormidesmis sp. RL_2_1]|nr:serine/threonine-protein phosphatase [Phormidesmis sp. RL_2_1]